MTQNAPLSSDHVFSLRIDKLAHDGRGIGFLPGHGRGRAVFVQGALPGQTVLCNIRAGKGNFLEANLQEILDAGLNTADPLCEHADICGGCPLQRMPYSLQLEWKESLLWDALTRIGGLDGNGLGKIWHPVVPSPAIYNFRNKLTLAFGIDNEGAFHLGLRKRNSHEVFSLKNCRLVKAGAMHIIGFMEEAILSAGIKPFKGGKAFWKQLFLRDNGSKNSQDDWRLRLVSAPSSQEERRKIRNIGLKILDKFPQCSAFIHDTSRDDFSKTDKRLLSLGKKGIDAAEAARLTHSCGGRIYETDISSFFQVNPAAAEELARLILSMHEKCQSKKNLLDIYCGSGFPGQLLGGEYESAIGIEIDPGAVAAARRNADKQNGWIYMQGDAGALLQGAKFGESFSTVLLDPPRAGIDMKVLDWLRHGLAENIIYVSCNPATLARDLKNLKAAWKLLDIGSVDMFPHTPHVETVALLGRSGA